MNGRNGILLAAVVAGMGLMGCGPDMALVRQYVEQSPRHVIAVMPFSVAPGQKDLRGPAENALKNHMRDLGFTIAQGHAPDPSAPLFGVRVDAPRVEDAQSFGQACHAPVVLVGRVERAQEGKAEAPPTYRDQRVWITDPATGRRTQTIERVEARPERAGVPPELHLALQLIDTTTGRVLWRETGTDSIPGWTLPEAARYRGEQMAEHLALAFKNQRL